MNKWNNGSWAVILISAFSLFILFLPIWNSGICISEGPAAETIGVCTRQWLQAVGPVIIGLIAIYPTFLSYLHAKTEKEKDRKIEKRTTLSAETILLRHLDDYYDTVLNSISSSIGVFNEYGNDENATEIANAAVKNIRNAIYNSDDVISQLNDKTKILSYDTLITGRQFFEYNIASLKYTSQLAINSVELNEKNPINLYTELSKDLLKLVSQAKENLSTLKIYILRESKIDG